MCGEKRWDHTPAVETITAFKIVYQLDHSTISLCHLQSRSKPNTIFPEGNSFPTEQSTMSQFRTQFIR